ncbi:MAG: hypothetical protein JOY78_03930 [Pseudonocardia sp.]|nr:hypothetical protein [Pseudonocardia sp.]
MAFTTVSVVCDYDLADGTDPTGTVSFTPSAPMINGITVVAAKVTERLNIDGQLRIDLAANTDPDTLPAGVTYLVEEDIGGAHRSYRVSIPHDQGASLPLYSIAQVSPPPAVSFPSVPPATPAIANLGTSGATRTLAPDGQLKLLTLSADCTISITAPTDPARAHTIDLVTTQDYLGNWRITWPASVRWPAGESVELSTFPGAVDKIRLTTYNGGTVWYGEILERDSGRAGRPLVGWSMPAGPRTIPGVANEILGRWQARNTWLEVAGALYLTGTEIVPYAAANPGRCLELGIALIPHDVANTQWNTELDAVIAGTHDTDHYNQGKALAALGCATVYARPWWEFNSENPVVHIDRAKFAGAWQRAVINLRRGFAQDAAPGQRLHVVYSPLPDRADQYVDFYPGDEYVDVISYDVYGKVYSNTNPSVPTMIAQVTAWLTDLAAFGRARGKPVAVSEWAHLYVPPSDGTFTNRGCGDCVEYIDLMFDWATDPANNVLYLVYYDSDEAGVGIDLDDTPLAKARLVQRAQAIQTTPAYPVPNAPTVGSATAGAGTASVTFTPAGTGAYTADYTATSTPGSLTGTSATSPITVSGLTPGTSYTFTVHANNQGGSSAESVASNAVTPYTSSIGFDQTQDRLLYSTIAPPSTFTITMWVYLTTDRGTWSTFLQLRDSGDATVAELAAGSSGHSGPLYWDGSGDLVGTTDFTVGAWRKIAITRTGSSGKLYSATPTGTTELISGTVNTATPSSLTLGSRGPFDGSQFWNGRIACVRVWSAVLSQAEIEAEWPSATPVRTSNLWANWRMAGTSDLTDTVSSRVLTSAGGGLTTEQGPPVT